MLRKHKIIVLTIVNLIIWGLVTFELCRSNPCLISNPVKYHTQYNI